ncbi:MAG: hypothetical protein ACQEW5_26940 [Bacillota bacterium]
MDVLLYYGLLLVIIAIAIVLFWMVGLPKIKSKNLSLVMIGLGLNVITTPFSLFLGVMAAEAPSRTISDFWEVFLIIQGIPLLILMIGILKWFIDNEKKLNI